MLLRELEAQDNFLNQGRWPKLFNRHLIALALVAESLGIGTEPYLFKKLPTASVFASKPMPHIRVMVIVRCTRRIIWAIRFMRCAHSRERSKPLSFKMHLHSIFMTSMNEKSSFTTASCSATRVIWTDSVGMACLWLPPFVSNSPKHLNQTDFTPFNPNLEKSQKPHRKFIFSILRTFHDSP